MSKKLFILILLALMAFNVNAQNCQPYKLVKPNCTTVSINAGYLINNNIGDYDFNKNYFGVGVEFAQFFNETFGVGGVFNYYGDINNDYDVNTNLYDIGAVLKFRVTDYFKPSVVDATFNAGLSYGRFDFEKWFDSDGVNYIVPNISFEVLFNLTSDKSIQLGIVPSYQYFIPTSDKWYFDDGEKVNSKISAFGLKTKININF